MFPKTETFINSQPEDVEPFLKNSLPPENLPRYKKLLRYKSYYDGHAYDGYQYDWNGYDISIQEAGHTSAESSAKWAQTYPTIGGNAQGIYTPLHMRKPSSQWNIAKEIVEGFTAYLFGIKRFPQIKIAQSGEVDDNQNEQQELDELTKDIDLETNMTVSRNIAGASGTSVIVMTQDVKTQKPILDVYDGRFCIPLWADRRHFVLNALIIQYPIRIEEIITQEANKEKGTIAKGYKQRIWERRVLQIGSDTVYESKVDKNSPTEVLTPEWTQKYKNTNTLGYIPAFWVQNYPNTEEMDGLSDYAGEYTLDEMDMINRMESACDKAVIGNINPTLVIKTTPEMMGKALGAGGAVRTGAGTAIIVGEKGDVMYLEVSGDSIKLGQERAKEKARKIFKQAHYISLDPEKFIGENLSGTALQTLLTEMFTQLGMYRRIWAKVIIGIIEIAYDMMGKSLKTPPTLQYGKYTEPSDADIKNIADSLQVLTGGEQIMDTETALEIIAKYIDIDVKKTTNRIEEKRQQAIDESKMGAGPGNSNGQ